MRRSGRNADTGGVARAAAATGLVSLALALAACTLGPEFVPPEPPAVERFTAATQAEATAFADTPGGAAQRFIADRDIPAEWWTLFRSPALDELVRRALAGSPTIAEAEARLRRANELLRGQTGANRYPDIDARLTTARVDAEPESLGASSLPFDFPLDLHLASVGVSYSLDLFGAGRRELEALGAEVGYEAFALEAARLTLAGNVVTSAIREAALREQIARLEELIALQSRQLAINEQRVAAGALAAIDLARLRGELAETRAALPELTLELDLLRHRLAEFVGRTPADAALPEFRLDELSLPAELPLSLPSELARQRPDIRAAEALLHRASANVGVATANLYPQLNLSVSFGALGTEADDLNPFSLFSASLLQPIFRGGELRANQRAAAAAYDQALAAYRQVVLQGFGEVADALRAIDADATILVERTEAARQARSVHAITSGRHEAGAVSTLELLDAEDRYARAAIRETQAVADRLADTAALFQALGGGWWNGEAAATAGSSAGTSTLRATTDSD